MSREPTVVNVSNMASQLGSYHHSYVIFVTLPKIGWAFMGTGYA